MSAKHPRLTKEQVEEIRRLYTTTPLNQKQIAQKVGRSRGTVSRVINGQTWKS